MQRVLREGGALAEACEVLHLASLVRWDGGEARSGGWQGGKQMRGFICIQMVCITFRSYSLFEAQVATQCLDIS